MTEIKKNPLDQSDLDFLQVMYNYQKSLELPYDELSKTNFRECLSSSDAVFLSLYIRTINSPFLSNFETLYEPVAILLGIKTLLIAIDYCRKKSELDYELKANSKVIVVKSQNLKNKILW